MLGRFESMRLLQAIILIACKLLMFDKNITV